MHTHIHVALSCIHMSCLHSVQAVGHGFLHRGRFQLFLYVHILTMFSSFNNLASVLSHRVCLSPPLSCFCTDYCECVPRGLLLYRRPVTLIDFTLSHFLSRCHSLSYPHSHLLPITGISVCTLRATVLSLFFMYCIMYGKRVRIDILIILEIEFTVLQGVLPQVVDLVDKGLVRK